MLLSKALQTTRATNKILFDAGTQIVKSSFKTTQSIANLYKNAGFKAFGFGKNLLKETLQLAADNQKVLKDTSIKAIKETVEIIRDQKEVLVENSLEAVAEIPVAQKVTKKKAKKEVTIDDLLKD